MQIVDKEFIIDGKKIVKYEVCSDQKPHFGVSYDYCPDAIDCEECDFCEINKKNKDVLFINDRFEILDL